MQITGKEGDRKLAEKKRLIPMVFTDHGVKPFSFELCGLSL